MVSVILFIHMVVCILLILIVLMQQGKGANAGAAFGSGGGGGASSLFGSKGPASFMFKLTCLLCVIFFSTSLLLGYLTSQQTKSESRLTGVAENSVSGSTKSDSTAPKK